ncbi:MAG: hypothetical protein L0229_12540 [Blastocatellia bacterium]|nr:hypothetical protein [Blastocatellia bacterium]
MADHSTNLTEDIGRLRYELELFLLGGEFDLYEDDRFIAASEPDRIEAEVSYNKLIFSCWGEGWSRSWRVTGCDATPERLRLECTKQMGRTRCTVELRRAPEGAETFRSRSEFAAELATLIEANLAGFRVEHAIAARDDRLHISGTHARLTLKLRGRVIAGIGVSSLESQATIDHTLAAGILWLDALSRKHKSIDRLLIFAPRGRAITIATRMTVVHPPGASISLYEVDEEKKLIEPVAAFDQGDVADHLSRAAVRALWARDKALPIKVSELIGSIARLAPGLVEAHIRGNRVKLSIRGLEFARVSTNRQTIEFGIDESKKKLNDANRRELEELVSEIVSRRRADSTHRNETVFRARSEAWLESLIRRDVTVLDPALDPRFAYSQVPAYRGEQRTFIDLLAATRYGRLAVIELKAAEDAEFPFQGLDYWLRVEWHLARGDFQRRGYFRGLRLTDSPPLLYLVAPLFRFHATTKLIASSVSDRVPVYRIGINEDWRAGVRVLLSERLN